MSKCFIGALIETYVWTKLGRCGFVRSFESYWGAGLAEAAVMKGLMRTLLKIWLVYHLRRMSSTSALHPGLPPVVLPFQLFCVVPDMKRPRKDAVAWSLPQMHNKTT
eukprot:6455098-Amphidinium_carterae.1